MAAPRYPWQRFATGAPGRSPMPTIPTVIAGVTRAPGGGMTATFVPRDPLVATRVPVMTPGPVPIPTTTPEEIPEIPPPDGSGACCAWVHPMSIDLASTGGRVTVPERTGACCSSCAAGEACASS